MQRQDSDPILQWKKIGGGTFRFGRRIIKPNQVFSAKSSEIPMGFRDTVILLNPEDGGDVEKIVTPPGASFEIHSKGSGWFDVVNVASGKAVNDKALRGEDAKLLLKELS